MDIDIRAVVELEPFHFASPDRLSPGMEDHLGWAAHWRDCLADSAIDIEPIGNTWFVPLRAVLHHPKARTIISKIARIDDAASMDEVCPLNGGLSFLRASDVLLVPQCCGDLSVRSEFRDALCAESETWTEVWIGHPVVCMRRRGAVLEVSQLIDEATNPDPACDFEIDANAFRLRLEALDDEIAADADLLAQLLVGLTNLDPVRVAGALVGNDL
jgi:hypothetical protein